MNTIICWGNECRWRNERHFFPSSPKRLMMTISSLKRSHNQPEYSLVDTTHYCIIKRLLWAHSAILLLKKRWEELQYQQCDLCVVSLRFSHTVVGKTGDYDKCHTTNCITGMNELMWFQVEDKPSSSRHPTTSDCIAIESRYANRIQRTAMEKMIEMQRYPPAGLVIDGDLTDYGHNPQLEEFKVRLNRNPPRIVPSPSYTIHAHKFPLAALHKNVWWISIGEYDVRRSIECIWRDCKMKMMMTVPLNRMSGKSRSEWMTLQTGWMKNFPIPIYPGLGNHDYQNNVNDCALNVCARNMLNWWDSVWAVCYMLYSGSFTSQRTKVYRFSSTPLPIRAH